MRSECATGYVYSSRESYLCLNGAYLLTYTMPEVWCCAATAGGEAAGLSRTFLGALAAAAAGVETPSDMHGSKWWFSD